MNFSTPIEHFAHRNEPVRMSEIRSWLQENKDYVGHCLKQSACTKWTNYLKSGVKPTHCLCATRNDECLFIEVYYELDNLAKFQDKETEYLALFAEFNEFVENNSNDNIRLKILELCYSHVLYHFSTVYEFYVQLEPFKKLIVKLDKQDFNFVFNFELKANQVARSIKSSDIYKATNNALYKEENGLSIHESSFFNYHYDDFEAKVYWPRETFEEAIRMLDEFDFGRVMSEDYDDENKLYKTFKKNNSFIPRGGFATDGYLTVGVESSFKNPFIRIHNFIAYHENPEFLFDMGDMNEMDTDYF